MPHTIEFYILPPGSENQLSLLILQLNTAGIHIHCDHNEHADQISQRLWECDSPTERFIPNMINTPCPLPVIHIGWGDVPSDRNLIINASTQILPMVHIEWVIGHRDSDIVAQARKRYAAYKQQGIQLTHYTQL